MNNTHIEFDYDDITNQGRIRASIVNSNNGKFICELHTSLFPIKISNKKEIDEVINYIEGLINSELHKQEINNFNKSNEA